MTRITLAALMSILTIAHCQRLNGSIIDDAVGKIGTWVARQTTEHNKIAGFTAGAASALIGCNKCPEIGTLVGLASAGIVCNVVDRTVDDAIHIGCMSNKDKECKKNKYPKAYESYFTIDTNEKNLWPDGVAPTGNLVPTRELTKQTGWYATAGAATVMLGWWCIINGISYLLS